MGGGGAVNRVGHADGDGGGTGCDTGDANGGEGFWEG